MLFDSDKTVTISYKEIKEICKKYKKKIFIFTASLALISVVYTLTRPVLYIAEGTFRDKAKANNGLSSFAGLLAGGNAQENNAISLMKSLTIRENAAKELNLQASLNGPDDRKSYLRNIWQHLFSEVYSGLYPYHLTLNDKEKIIKIQDVVYNREIPHNVTIQFLPNKTFKLTDGKKELTGKIGEPFSHDDYQFTFIQLKDIPDHFLQKTYQLRFKALSQISKEIFDNLTVVQDKIDKSLLNIKFQNQDRKLATEFVNTLMSVYKNYLKNEQNEIIQHQIKYLEKRQDEIGNKLKNSMESHVLKISEDIQNIGFPNTQLAMEFLTESQNALQKKLLDIEFELKRLQNSQKAGYVYYDTYALPGDPAVINQILAEMRNLKQQKAALHLKLQDFKAPKQDDLQSFDLKASQDLFIAYTHKLNEIESQMMQNKFIVDKLSQENFELSSLGTILNDHVSLDVSSKATLLALNLKDSNNRSLKEQERIQEDLDLQKRFLSNHLENANELLALNEDLMHYKVKSLQSTTLGLLTKQISLLENNLSDYIQNRIDNLKAEADVIEQHKMALMAKMSLLPSKWVSEKVIHLEMDVNQKMVEEVSKLVETKNIGSNLEIIQSTVIDGARLPITPKSARPVLFGILGGFIGLLSSGLFFVFRDMARNRRE